MTIFSEEPYGAADRIELPPLPLAVIRHDGIRIDDLTDLFDTGYAHIAAQFGTGRLTPSGPALAIYYGNPMDVFDLELGFPVSEPLSEPLIVDGAHTITGSLLPAGAAAATTHTGSYDTLGESWGSLVTRADENGWRLRGISIEVYVSDPTVDPSEMRTDLILPIEPV